MSRMPYHTDLHPGRKVYMTSWFILSVLFFTGGETSVVPTHVGTVPKYRSNSVYTSSYKRHHTVQYSTKTESDRVRQTVQSVTRHSREHTLSAVGPDAQVE